MERKRVIKGLDSQFDVVPVYRDSLNHAIEQLRQMKAEAFELTSEMKINIAVTYGSMESQREHLTWHKIRAVNLNDAWSIGQAGILESWIHSMERRLERFQTQLVMAEAQEKAIGQVLATLTGS